VGGTPQASPLLLLLLLPLLCLHDLLQQRLLLL
jgi:hypothetical protein